LASGPFRTLSAARRRTFFAVSGATLSPFATSETDGDEPPGLPAMPSATTAVAVTATAAATAAATVVPRVARDLDLVHDSPCDDGLSEVRPGRGPFLVDRPLEPLPAGGQPLRVGARDLGPHTPQRCHLIHV
jgi:hypothetical protein